ncbi:MAG: TIGR03546 family protein, partial [Desulfobacterales bacterium]|nr:TIGR03546 family protein [Desulfobacterales bacterium]
MLRAIARLLSALNSETEPGQISLAFCFAMIAGLTPLFSLHNLLVLLIVLLLRVNLSTFILGLALFSGIAYLLDPLFHGIGLAVLTAGALEGLWTALYNTTLFRLEKFNNSIVMGSLLFSVVLFVPLYFISNQMIARYREHVLAWVQKSRIMQAFKGTKLYRLYS